jgi:hypothetical protein
LTCDLITPLIFDFIDSIDGNCLSSALSPLFSQFFRLFSEYFPHFFGQQREVSELKILPIFE